MESKPTLPPDVRKRMVDFIEGGTLELPIMPHVARQVIARARRWNVEEGFLCGLLHDVGRPVLLQAMVDLHRELGYPLDRQSAFAAMDEFHCRVGKYLTEEWTLPARVAETILYHHDP